MAAEVASATRNEIVEMAAARNGVQVGGNLAIRMETMANLARLLITQ